MSESDRFLNQVILGDFRDYEIPEEAFMVSDPPYNQGYHYDQYEDDIDHEQYQKLLVDAFFNRKSVVILYPEETINILGGGEIGICGTGSLMGIPKQYRQTIQAHFMVGMQT